MIHDLFNKIDLSYKDTSEISKQKFYCNTDPYVDNNRLIWEIV